MKRSPPSISEAQAKSIATYSKLQAQTEAHSAKVEAMGRDLDRSFAQMRSDRKKFEIGEQWFTRIAVVPISILAVVGTFVVLYGLWTGDLPEISKYSKVHVLRAENPIEYWFAFSYHAAVTCAFIYLAVRLLRATGWIRGTKI
jgi:hypothetical protein